MRSKRKWLFAAAIVVAALITAFLYAQTRTAGSRGEQASGSAQPNVIRLQATKEDISNKIEVKGKSSYANEKWVYAPFASEVKNWNVKDGAQVRQGDVLFELDDSEIRSAIALKEANLRKQQIDRKLSDIQARLAEAKPDEQLGDESGAFDRYAGREQKQAERELADVQMELDRKEIQASEKKLAEAAFKAPRNGIFLFEGTKEPQRVDTEEPIGKIVDISKLQLISTVGEYDVFRIKPGMDVKVKVDALKDTTLKGKVEQVSKFAKSGTDPAQFEVVVSLEQRPEMIAGLSLVGTIETDSKKDVVVVPTLAVMRDDEGYYVYVERNGAVEKQPVKIGLETPEKTEVIGGIREGDTVVLQ